MAAAIFVSRAFSLGYRSWPPMTGGGNPRHESLEFGNGSETGRWLEVLRAKKFSSIVYVF